MNYEEKILALLSSRDSSNLKLAMEILKGMPEVAKELSGYIDYYPWDLDTDLFAIVAINMSHLSKTLGNPEQAKKWLEEGFTLANIYAEEDDEELVEIKYQLGLLYYDAGDFQKAKEHIEDALRRSPPYDDNPLKPYIQYLLAEIRIGMDEDKDLEYLLSDALPHFEEGSLQQAKCQHYLAKVSCNSFAVFQNIEAMIHKAVATFIRILGKDHPQTLKVLDTEEWIDEQLLEYRLSGSGI